MNRPIRILQVVTYMNRGGLESMLMNYYRSIDKSCIQFDFLTHCPEGTKQDFEDEILSMGGKIYHLPRLNPFSIKYRKELNKFFESNKEYKIIHVHQDCMSSLILKYARKNGIHVRIAHSHNALQDKNFKFLIKMFYKTLIPKYATDLFACGEKAGSWMFPNKEYKVLNNAIDVKKFKFDQSIRNEYRRELGIEDKLVIGHIGRFCNQKNHRYIVQILKELSSLNDNFVMLLIGVGELQEKIKNQISALNMEDRVRFLGLRTDIPQLLMAMDVFLFPSFYEGLPVTLIEAQASGLPCVISNTITHEIDITDCIQRIKLNDSIRLWGDAILKAKSKNRENYADLVRDNHYDIEFESLYLSEFYLKKWEQR